jgi:hypothetical protein
MASRALLACSALAAALAIFAFATCYRPSIPDGAFVCGPNGLCPSGFVCLADSLCHRPSSPHDAGLDQSVPDSAFTPPDLGPDLLGYIDGGMCSPRTLSFASSTAVTFPAMSGPAVVAAADLNGDQILDLVTTTYKTNLVEVMLGKGGAAYNTPSTYRLGTMATEDAEGLSIADFNGDGLLDIVATSPASMTVSILKATAPGVFSIVTPTFTTPYPPITAIAADFNGDHKVDVAIGFLNGSFVVATGNGDATLTGAPILGAPLKAIGDWNHDGKLDIAGADFSTADMALGRTVNVELGLGTGSFTIPGSSTLVGSGPAAMVGADFNHDGKLDLAVANFGSNSVTIMLGKGDGTFTVGATLQTGAGPNGVVASDFNCDGTLDLVVTNGSGTTVSVFSGNGDGTFGTAIPFNAGTGPGAPIIGDFDGDGWLDVMVTDYGTDMLTVLLNQP